MAQPGHSSNGAILGLRAVSAEGSVVLVWGNLLAGLSVLVPAMGGPAPTPLDIGTLVFLGVFQLGLAGRRPLPSQPRQALARRRYPVRAP